MSVHSRVYKAVSILVTIGLLLSFFPTPAQAGRQMRRTMTSDGTEFSPLPTDRDASQIVSSFQEQFSPELADQLVDMGFLTESGAPANLLMDAQAMQAAQFTVPEPKPYEIVKPLSLSRIQSAYTPATAVSNTITLTFNVSNNTYPTIALEDPATATVTETLSAVQSLDFSNDPNVIHDVLLTDDLLPANATVLSSSIEPHRSGDTLAWNLGRILPQESISVTIQLSVPPTVSDFTDLDGGAAVWGTLQGRAVSASVMPASLAPDAFGDWLQRTIDADYYDPYLIKQAAELGNDHISMFEYVRSLSYESYKGSLRGTRGTLWSEAGNSMDKASLLIAMLRGSGVPARYVNGPLNAARTQELILSMFPPTSSLVGSVAADAVLSDPANDPQLIAETQDHWWVEAYIGGSWVTLDPSFGYAAPGQLFADSVTNVYAEVPDTLRHKVTVRVKIENYHPLNFGGGSPGISYSYPLVHTFNAVELSGRPVTLEHTINTTSNSGAVFFYVQHTYSPYLIVGDFEEFIEGSSYQEMISNFPFGTILTTAEWLVFEIKDVDGNVDVYERDIFDTVGAEARQSGGQLTIDAGGNLNPKVTDFESYTVLFNSGRVSVDFLEETLQELRVKEQAFLSLRDELAPLINDPDLTDQEKAALQPLTRASKELIRQYNIGRLATFSVLDDNLTEIGDLALVRAYSDHPRVLIANNKIEYDETTETATMHAQFDLLQNRYRVLAAPGQNVDAIRGFRVLHGVGQSSAEGMVGEQLFGLAGISTAKIFELAVEQEIDTTLITGENLADLEALPISAEAKANITKDITAGNVVIVPTEMVTVDGEQTIGWWSVDLETGETVGVLENGRHGFADYSLGIQIAIILGATFLITFFVTLVGEWLEARYGYGVATLITEFLFAALGGLGLKLGLWEFITTTLVTGTMSTIFWAIFAPLLVAGLPVLGFLLAVLAVIVFIALILLMAYLGAQAGGSLGSECGQRAKEAADNGAGFTLCGTPDPPTATATATATATVTVTPTSTPVPPTVTNTPTPTVVPPTPQPTPTVITYEIAPGEYLNDIVSRYNDYYNSLGLETSVGAILSANPCGTVGADFSICNAREIFAGQRIYIPFTPIGGGSLIPNGAIVAVATPSSPFVASSKPQTVMADSVADVSVKLSVNSTGKQLNEETLTEISVGVANQPFLGTLDNTLPITGTLPVPVPPILIGSTEATELTEANAAAVYVGSATIAGNQLTVDVETEHATFAGYLSSNWQSTDQTSLRYEAFSAVSATVKLLDGTVVGTGQVEAWSAKPQPLLLSGANLTYDVSGWSDLANYSPAINGSGIATEWATHVVTATATTFDPFVVAPLSIAIDGQFYGGANYIVELNSPVTIWGREASLAPLFINEWEAQLNAAAFRVSPGSGSADLGGFNLNVGQGIAAVGFTGGMTVTEQTTTTDRVELAGTVDQLVELSLSPAANGILPFQSAQFHVDVLSNIADTYYLQVEGPDGWQVALDGNGAVTLTPDVGIGYEQDYTFLVTAQSYTHPELIVSAEHTVTILPNQGMALDIVDASAIVVPFGPADSPALPLNGNNGQIPLPDAAYTAFITNTSTVSHTFEVTVSGLDPDWIIFGGYAGQTTTTLTLGPGDVGWVELYVSPSTSTLPPVSTDYPFNITGTALDAPTLTETASDVFTVPAIAFNRVSADPQKIYVSPDTAASFDFSVENIGNTAASFPITITVPVPAWTSSYVNSTGSLASGATHTQTVTFMPVGAAAGEDYFIRAASPIPDTNYIQSVSVAVAVREPEIVCAFQAAQASPTVDAGLTAALDDLLIQLELWRDLNNLTQRDHVVTALQNVVVQLSFYPGMSVTAQLSDLAVQISGHTDTGDLTNDRVILGNLLCQDLQPALTLLSAYNPGFSNFPAVAATVPGRTVTTTLTAVNHGDSPATAEFTLSNVPAGWDVITPTQVSLTPGVVQQIPLSVTPHVLGTNTFSVTMRLLEVPELAITRTMAVRVVSELLTITAVDLDPAELNVGTGTTDVSIHLANPAGFRASTTVEVQLTDGTGSVRKSFSTPFTVPVNNSGPFLLGQFNIDGLEEGVYTATVRLLDTDNSLIPNAVGMTHLPIGQDLRVTYDLTPALVAPGQTGVTATTTITTERTDVLTTTVPFTSTIKWNNSIPSDSFSAWNQVIAMPVVGDINGDDIPDVVYNSYQGINWFSDGILRVVSGDDGTEIFKVTAQRTMPMGTPAIVDLDNDGAPEILIHRSGGGLYAFNNTGGLKYSSTAVYTGNPQFGSSPTIADLNGDGLPEVIVGRNVLNNTLSSLTSLGSGGQSGEGRAVMSVVADVDLDGDLEVIAGNTIYHGSGGILAQNTAIADGFNAIGNFNTDPYPEIVMVAAGAMYLLDNQMNIIWGPVVIPGGGSGPQNGNGGPPTVADFDNDGMPEIGVAGLSSYRVIDTDGTLLWARSSVDNSGVTGSSVFDFQGDGQAEVVYGDENTLYIYDGSDGTILFQQPRPSATVTDGPVVADVDGDGHADIIVPANTGFGGSYTGIRVFQAVDNSWVNTRQLWYQHAYDIVSVNDDMRVVTNPTPVWQFYNTFRTQAPTPVQGNAYFVDIVHGLAITNTSLLTDTISPTPLQATAEQIHWLYAQQDREAIKAAQLSQSIDSPLQPGEARPLSTGTVISYTLNSNTTVVNIPPLYVSAPHIISMAPEEVTVSPGATAVYTVTLTNAFATAQTIDLNVVGLNESWVTFTDTVTLASSETVELPLIVSVPADADAVAYPVMVQALLTGGGEDVTSAVLNVSSGPELSVSPPLQFAAYGDTVTYTVTLTNTAAQAEQYTFTTDGLGGLPVDLPAAVSLAPGETASDVLTVTAQTRESALPFVVQATGDTGLSASDEAGLDILNGPGVQATLSPQTAVAGKGSPALYTLVVTNTGSIADVYNFTTNLPTGWQAEFKANGVTIDALALTSDVFNSSTLNVLVTPPITETSATFPFQVNVVSQSDPDTVAVVGAQTQVVSQGVVIAIVPESVTMDPNGSQTWNVTVTNTGDSSDTFQLQAGGIVSATADFTPQTVTLAAGDSTVVQLSASDLDLALPATYPFAVIAESVSNLNVTDFANADVTFTGFEGVSTSITPTLKVVDGFTSEHQFTMVITNTGNVGAAYTINGITTLPGGVFPAITDIFLPPHTVAAIPINVSVGAPGTYLITVQADSESLAASDSATATLVINAINTPPDAIDDNVTTPENTTVSINVLVNDTDADGDGLTVTNVTMPTNGMAVINPNNTVTYTPNVGFNGNDSFSYTISDGNGGSDTAAVTITVEAVNDEPAAVDDTATTPEDTVVTVDVLANDTDPEGATLTVTGVTTPPNGTAVINPDNTVTYTPDADFNGSDNFNYTISDGNGGAATAAVTVTVTAVNDNPVAVGDSATTAEDTAVIINLLSNDSDVDGDTLAVSAVVQPGNGLVVINPDNTITYTPDPDFNSTDHIEGDDSFTYTVSDGNGGSDTATVTVTVTPVNDNPVALDDSATTAEDTAVTINVLANDTDVEGDALTITGVTQPASGSVVNNGTDVTYTPDANYNGSNSFSYTVEDGNGGSDTAMVTVLVNPVNDAAIAVDDSATTAEDTAVTITVLTNDTDADGDVLTVTAVTTPTKGTAVLNPGNTITYTPNANFNGSDSFSYTVNDGNGGNDTAVVSITITPVNDAPTAVDDTVTTLEDTAAVLNVLGNDTDIDGDALTVTGVSSPANGTAVINPDDTITYTPDANYNSSDSFTYTISDGSGGGDTATVSVTITPVNDAPVAVDDAVSTAEDTAVTVSVLTNDTDVDGDTLSVTGVTTPTIGTVVINPDKTITYTPNANFNGSDSFSYTVEDGNGGSDTATVTITVTPVNDAPVAANDSATTPEDTAVTLNVLASDSDVDGDSLIVATTTAPANGAVVINPDDSITYTPNGNYNGSDSFSYTVEDGNGGSDTATVTITVTPVNDAPVAVDDAVSTAEDTAVSIDVLSNDTDVEGDSLTVTTVTAPTNGTAVINPDDTITYTPDANHNGSDSFSYTVEDGNGGSDTATVSVTVTSINDAPVAVDDAVSTAEDMAVTLNVLANDSDVDGDSLIVASVSTPVNGTAVINPDDTVTYTPNANFNGSDSFSYTIEDGSGGMDVATVTVTVSSVNDVPVAVNESATAAEDSAVTVDVLANDTDDDGDTLTVTSVTTSTNGTAVLNLDNSITYTPDANYNGSDSFSYTAEDGNGGSDTAIVTITVTPVNDAPLAVNDSATTAEDTAVAIDVLSNDTDVDGDTLTVTSVTTPTNGTAVINPDDTITYTPDANFYGSDSFSYTINDGNGGSDTTTVAITVTLVNDAPIAVDDSATTLEDTAVTIDVLANDSDIDGHSLAVSEASQAGSGTVVVNPDNTITYTPDPDFNSLDSIDGTDVFTYTVSDGSGGTSVAAVSITVTPVNDAPDAADDQVSTDEDMAVTIDVLANDSDVDGDPLIVTSVTTPTNGTAVINLDNSITYTPEADFNGADSFMYTVDDGNGETSTAVVTIAVSPANDTPVAANDSATTAEDTPVTVDVLANDSDVDGDILTVTGVTTPTNGTAVINLDNSITYTPDANFNGSDSFAYTVDDGGDSDTATVTITVTPVNDAPVAADDAVTTAENTAITIDVLANDSDVDGDTLTVTAVTTPTNGTAVINPDSSITFTPATNFSGADNFSYTVEDGSGGTDTAVVNITVTAENDNPVAVDDSATTPEDMAVTIDVLANDTDADGNLLTVTNVTAPANGTAVINPDNSVTYTPDANFYGSDSFSYEVEDGSGGSDSAVVTVTVTPVNDVPLAEDDAATTPEDTAVTIDVLANDSDVEGDTLTIQNATAPANGTAVVNLDGTITYTPDTGLNGIDSFSYTVSDGNGGMDTATVTVVVTPVVGSCDLYPIALHETTLDGAAVGDVIEDILNGKAAGNFGWLTWSGENGVPSLVTSLTPPGNSYTYVNPNDPNDHTVSLGDWVEGKPGVSNARAVRDALDTLKSIDIVVPVWDLNTGSGANVEYRVVDFALVRILDYQLPQQDRITVQFLGFTACEAGNANPVAQDDGITALVDMPVVINALANDTDNDGDTLTIQSIGAPANGSAVLNPDRTITYTPNAGFMGTDTFLYTVTDGRGETDTATVTVVVAPEASNCDLYPIALHVDTLEGAAVGDIIENILNGKSVGNFGWLTWSGDNGMPMLIESLGSPGNSHTYINPQDSADHIVSPGDWVHGKPGVSNTQDMRQAMDTLKSLDIVVPVWDTKEGSGANVQYHIVSFAVVRLVDYQLAQLDQITVQFLGYATCGAMSEAPGSGVAMAEQIWVSAVEPVWQRRLG